MVETRNTCYNPKDFLFLANARNLPLSTDTFSDVDAIAVFQQMHGASKEFEEKTLPNALQLAKELYNYGMEARAIFSAAANLLRTSNDRDSVRELFNKLIATARDCQHRSQEVHDGVSKFEYSLSIEKDKLDKIIDKEVNISQETQSRIEQLINENNAARARMQSAQARLEDDGVKNATKYYVWIPLIGTIIALENIMRMNKDIQEQSGIINELIEALKKNNSDLDGLNSKIKMLTHCGDFSKGLVGEIKELIPSLEKIVGVWGTIALELSAVVENIEGGIDPGACLAEVALTTAADEWAQVADDAHNFMMGFPVQPLSQAAA